MARAYILIRAKVGAVEQLREALAALPGVRQVDVVTGDYDLVAVVEVPTAEDLGRLVMREIHGLDTVASTTTYVVVG